MRDTATIKVVPSIDGRKLMAVVHRRALDVTGLKEIRLNGRYSLTVLENQDPATIRSFVKQFNDYVSSAK